MRKVIIAVLLLVFSACLSFASGWENLVGPGISGSTLSLTCDGTSIFATDGAGTFKRYDVSTGTWQLLSRLDAYGAYVSIAADHNGHIFAAPDTTGAIRRYTIATNSWDSLAVLNFTPQVGLAFDGSDGLFTTDNSHLRKYSISANQWQTVGPLLQHPLYSLASNGSGTLYAEDWAWQLDAGSASRGQLSGIASSMPGGQMSLAWASGSVYAINGSGNFCRYDTAAAQFEYLPSGFYASKVALTYDGGQYLYAATSNGTFARYAVPEPSSMLALLAGAVTAAGAAGSRRRRA